MSPDDAGPDVSVVVVSPYEFDTFGPLLARLANQTIADRIELVLVASTPRAFELDESMTGWSHSVRTVLVDSSKALGAYRVAGVRAAAAPVVVLTEDHCFPHQGWAEALRRAHEGPWAAVGPMIVVANPWRYRSWANHLIQYAPWVHGTPGGPKPDVAGHNSSYKRDALLELEPGLDELFAFEPRLHTELRRRGHELYMEAAASAYHVYITKPLPYVREHFHIGRSFAATRSRGWPLAKRLFYALASPIVPTLRAWRIAGRMRELGWFGDLMPGILPSLLVGLGASAFGEFLGYAFGIGDSLTKTVDLDLRRFRFVAPDEREAIWGRSPDPFLPDPPRPRTRASGSSLRPT